MTSLVLPSTAEDALAIAQNLRPADTTEIDAWFDGDADPDEFPYEAALLGGFNYSESPMTLHVDGKPAAMFGVVPEGCDAIYHQEADNVAGRIWLLGTPAIEDVAMYFLRESKKWLKQLTDGYNFIFNYAHKNNQLHLKWLHWLNFDVGETVEHSDFVFISYTPEVVPHV